MGVHGIKQVTNMMEIVNLIFTIREKRRRRKSCVGKVRGFRCVIVRGAGIRKLYVC